MEVSTAHPAHFGGWPPRLLSFLVIVLGSLITVTVSYASYDATLGISAGWASITPFACVAAVLWREPGRPRDPLFWWGLGATGAFLTIGGLLAGITPTRALYVAVAQILGGWLIVALLRSWYGRTNVAPATTEELVLAITAIAIGCALTALLGGFPGRWGHSWSPRTVLWWASRFFVGCICSLLPLALMMFWRRSAVPHVRSWLHGVPLVAGTVLAPLVAFRFHNLALTWVMLIAAIWAGMVLSPVATTLFGLLLAITTGFVSTHYMTAAGYNRQVSTSVVIDLLTSSAVALATMISIFRDQSARLQARTESQSTLLHAVFESVNDGIVLVGRDQRVTLHNQRATEMLGTDWPDGGPDEWVRHFDVRVRTDQQPQPEDLAAMLPSTDRQAPLSEIVVGGRDGLAERHVDLTAQWVNPHSDEQLMLLLHDVTAERRRQSELTHFARTVAHDLRTPLAGIQGWLELGQEAVEDGDTQMSEDSLCRALIATRRATEVIEDWLAYSITHDGTLHPVEVELRHVTDIALDPATLGTLPDGSELVVDVPHTVLADRNLLVRLVANLVGNSVKYAKPGHGVHLEIRSRDAGEGWVEMQVRDHGLGFEPGDENLVFGEYHRGNRDKGYRPGTGLGLSLCRSIVKRHGGWIVAERNDEGGATVRFTLPAAD